MLIGAHVSTRQGYSGAALAAHKMGANTFQFFPKNPRSLVLKTSYNEVDARDCANFCSSLGMISITHAPYALNLAADASEQDLMKRALLNCLEITEACGALGLVVHFGKNKGTDRLQAYKNIIQLTNESLQEWHGNALILIENQAGEGTGMGTTLEELATIRKLSHFPDQIGYCLDTCHAFASGLWDGHNWEAVAERGSALDFFKHLKAVHLNDSLYPAGSRRDRHATIGSGHIGDTAIQELIQSPVLQHIPFILETPQGKDGTHREEINHVQTLYYKK
ncbi:deoxyribonuclease IV [Paenibacillus albiflavus]|uniref:Deoxyribonuclease IV n=1 Tax=Paenibacillus albiflavus TaxID=2545760 RepID=A0A4V2WPY9_9BACL|nr:deoxyribonuclease IV [Paenibacillus albiflavus]TCZ81302.1 deoxyribonuclease IV [Paenibacillus albiflavus]